MHLKCLFLFFLYSATVFPLGGGGGGSISAREKGSFRMRNSFFRTKQKREEDERVGFLHLCTVTLLGK